MKAKPDSYWKQKLTPEQYRIMRQKGTEAPFTGKFFRNDKTGTYNCVACGTPLFSTNTQYESHMPGLAGWPSFGDVLQKGNVVLKDDNSLGMHRTEVVCKTCGGHLGHLFADEESPTGQHYCINSCALDFKPKS